jgi:uncharacterized membrane protein YfcA
VHNRRRNIDWRVTGLLAAGSLPATVATLPVLKSGNFRDRPRGAADHYLRPALATMLLLIGGKLVMQPRPFGPRPLAKGVNRP